MDRILSLTASDAARSLPVSAPTHATPPDRDFRQVLGELGDRIDRGQRALDRVVQGNASLDGAQLLALQLQTYRYAEAVELAGKLADKASSGVKTVLQGQ